MLLSQWLYIDKEYKFYFACNESAICGKILVFNIAIPDFKLFCRFYLALNDMHAMQALLLIPQNDPPKLKSPTSW